nr:reverse transcriptase domain-containing protein [Tanacetum cinerariifolium]
MLGEHNIAYLPRMSVKGQVQADFLTEMPDENPPVAPVVETQQDPWTLFTDGSSCVDGSSAGLILTSPEGTEFTYTLRFQFAASNNEAEYEALIAGLQIAAQMGVQRVHVSVDSKLIANQVLGTYVAKEKNMIKYLEKVKNLVLLEILKEKSIKEKQVTTMVEEDGPTWMTPVMEYLKEGTLPSDRNEARKLRIKARQENHEGSCSMHAGPRSVVAKAIRLGYYWLTMHRDARDMIRICNDCQIHFPITKNPQQPLTPITAPWTFYKWGIDIADPFPEGSGKVKFLIVSIDYFTKWIEAKAVATITGCQVKKFVWDNIVCRFGLPGEIVSDNGKQFSDNPFKDRCDKLNITQRFASVKHPQSNGLVERANRSLGEGIKARLGKGSKNWVEELPHVLWAHLVDVVYNDEELPLNLDLLEERRERAAILDAKAKLKMTKYYNARVRGVTFRPCDFVYRGNDVSHAGRREARTKVGRTLRGKELDLSNLGEAPSSDVSVCVAASFNRIARPYGETVGTDTGTPSDLA